jgi:O-antigen/teichoic acid export membrane protein
MIFAIYSIALLVAYFIPSYTANPYLMRGLPLGMLFSASFMTAGILQLPLQLFWKMEQVSIGLIIARVVQLTILALTVYILFPGQTFTHTGPISPFLMIIFSVLASGIAQGCYVYRAGRKFLRFTRVRDWSFTKSIITDNRQYGIAYYLSSFHTLIVLILLSIFYPSIANFDYVGIWALALSLLEILLIVPSSLGNSLIHKLSHASHETKITSF